MNIVKYIGSQFANPRGIGGILSTFLMNSLNQVQYNGIKKYCPENNSNILDIGFGNGYLINKLSKNSNNKFYGIEMSEDMIKLATKKNKNLLQQNRLYLQLMNASDLQYNADLFDYIYTVNTMYFWENPRIVYNNIFKVLKKNCYFVNAFYSKEWLDKMQYTKYDFNKYTPDEILNFARDAGFHDVEIHCLKLNTSFLIIAKK